MHSNLLIINLGMQVNEKRSSIPHPPSTINSTQYTVNYTFSYPPASSNASSQQQQQQQQPGQQQSQTMNTGVQSNINTTADATTTAQQNQTTSLEQNAEPKKPEGGKRKVLMHFAYLHPQEHKEIPPTKPPAPTPPLRIEPQSKCTFFAILILRRGFWHSSTALKTIHK